MAGADAAVGLEALPINQARAALPAEVLGDGEIVILLLKPSLWYILLSSLGVLIGVAFIATLLAYAALSRWPLAVWSEDEAFIAGLSVALIRLGWQSLDWWNQTYVLTDRRIISVFGIIRRQTYQAPLYNIQHIAVIQSVRERVLGLGTIAFATAGSDTYATAWLSLSHPYKVYQQVNKTIDRYGGGNGRNRSL